MLTFGSTDLIQEVLVLAAPIHVPVFLGETLLCQMKYFHILELLSAFILHHFLKKHQHLCAALQDSELCPQKQA